MNFQEYLQQKKVDPALQSVLLDTAAVFVEIAAALKTKLEGYVGSENIYGDKQVKMDLVSNDFFVERFKKNQAVALIGSEELQEPLVKKVSGKGYAAVFDPLDGSSIVDTNLSVGTIIGFYEGDHLQGRTGKEQVAALISVYGPRLTFLISTGDSVDEFLYNDETQEFQMFHENMQIHPTGKIYSPGNIKASISELWYENLLKYWMKGGYLLRYSGGMVPDINQILKKGGGVFVYPGTKDAPEGKLRLLYECAPVAYIIERAGGSAHSGKEDILEIPIESYHQQSPIFVGSKKEVSKALHYFQGGA